MTRPNVQDRVEMKGSGSRKLELLVGEIQEKESLDSFAQPNMAFSSPLRQDLQKVLCRWVILSGTEGGLTKTRPLTNVEGDVDLRKLSLTRGLAKNKNVVGRLSTRHGNCRCPWPYNSSSRNNTTPGLNNLTQGCCLVPIAITPPNRELSSIASR